ncbi:MAG TPA: FAD-dependent oxidoreductase [Verrucomicrobiae bacterium]|nr:FAD-dependent oxidoreductase [Verrucomicrobiae bacterium]
MSKVVVIGGGVIGLCTAYYTAWRGHSVTLLDRAREDHEGCSFGNAGMVVPSHIVPLAAPGAVSMALKWMPNPESPFWVKPRLDWELFDWGWKFWRASTRTRVGRAAPFLRDLHLASRTAFEELAAICNNEFGLVQKGLLMLCKTAHTLEEEGHAAEYARQLGIPAEVLDAKQTATLDPNVTMDVAGSVYFPKDCHLTPGRFMAVMKSLCVKAGIQFSYETDVLGFESNGSAISVARTDKGEIKGDEFVLAGGSWSTSLAGTLGLKIPIQAGKGYSLTLKKPRELPNICSILTEARIAVTPMGSALRFGGTMEIAGLNETINPVRVRGIIRSIPKYYPEFRAEDFEGVQPWSGLRPCSPDGLPYLGRTSSYRNLCLATGHAMMGLSLGPVTGKLVAAVLSGEAPAIDLGLLNPDRFM